MDTKIISQLTKSLPAVLKPVATLLLPAIPAAVINQYESGKMTLASLKNNEDMFNELLAQLNKQIKQEHAKALKQESHFETVSSLGKIETAEKYSRYVATLRDSLKYIKSDKQQSHQQQDAYSSWYDVFKDIAMRMNEDWRQDLLARCLAEMEDNPDSISLKSLWDIGLLDTQTFHAFALFLDSSVDLDGYPINVLNRDDLAVKVVTEDKSYEGILIYLISGLMEKGLIKYGEFEIPSSEPVVVSCCSLQGSLQNLAQKDGLTTMIRLEGFHCTDLGLDLYRLYDPIYNRIAEANFQVLKEMLDETVDVKFLIKE